MSRPRPAGDDPLRPRFDEVVRALAGTRRTFTEEEALRGLWDAGYNATPQDDPRFELGRESDGRAARHWHLAGQVVANDRLVEALDAGTWDGRDVDTELARLDGVAGGHHVFCPADNRLIVHGDGRVELADDERDPELAPHERSALDALADRLLDRWRAAGPVPWTARQLTEALVDLGWERGRARGGWQLARGWLRDWPAVVRVGRDYWFPANALPSGPARTRLSVARAGGRAGPPVGPPAGPATTEAAPASGTAGRAPPIPAELTTTLPGATTRWTATLRTVHVLEGFLPVPAEARAGYPPAGRGGGNLEALRGLWFESGESFVLWLDRANHILFGPELADRLAWREAGERFEITWAAERVAFRPSGSDAEVQREETRLADTETLAALRGGVGESYRQSAAAVLSERADGLPFRDLLAAVRARQGHEVHRGTMRAVLNAGGFVCRDRRWYAGPDEGESRRLLRAAVVLAGETAAGGGAERPGSHLLRVATTVAERCRALRQQLDRAGG